MYEVIKEWHSGADIYTVNQELNLDEIKAICPIKAADDYHILNSPWFKFYFRECKNEGDYKGIRRDLYEVKRQIYDSGLAGVGGTTIITFLDKMFKKYL